MNDRCVINKSKFKARIKAYAVVSQIFLVVIVSAIFYVETQQLDLIDPHQFEFSPGLVWTLSWYIARVLIKL